ncbi:MAG: LacI family DNA-binding transcriptional regulator [Butyricicoccus sp.]|nr:LacI family DNA-binding transcriptional regulator [Butyricicoccus sp.]
MEKAFNIREVARIAGVSPATVSRVINGSANVSAEKRERVLQVVSQTDFVPNEAARALFKKSARLIGLIIPSVRNPFFTELAGIIDRTASAHGYRLFLCNVGDDLEKEKAAFQMLVSMNADGIIIASNTEGIEEHIENCRIPVVAVDSRLNTNAVNGYVYSDYRQGGRLAAEHLIRCGCRNIVCIQGPQRFFTARERFEGYREVCRERGLPVCTVTCDYDFDAGLAMTEELLRTYPDVDGIIACNDVVAASTYKILHKKSIPVPDRIQLIGYDDVNLSRLISPELTTISQPIEDLAVRATELIIESKGKDKNGECFVFPVRLKIRDTTKKEESES